MRRCGDGGRRLHRVWVVHRTCYRSSLRSGIGQPLITSRLVEPVRTLPVQTGAVQVRQIIPGIDQRAGFPSTRLYGRGQPWVIVVDVCSFKKLSRRPWRLPDAIAFEMRDSEIAKSVIAFSFCDVLCPCCLPECPDRRLVILADSYTPVVMYPQLKVGALIIKGDTLLEP